METAVTSLRDLWRQRVLVAVFALVALIAGGLLAFRPGLPPESRQYRVGSATARILVDTPDSQVVALSPRGLPTLAARASLLASLMTEGDVKDAIAKSAGLRPAFLLAVEASSPVDPTATLPHTGDPRIRLLSTRVLTNEGGADLPIIEARAEAMSAVDAGRLADAAVAGLRDYVGTKAASQSVLPTERLRLRSLGPAQAHWVSRGPGRLLALVAVLVLFATLCAALIVARALAQGWRVASVLDESDFADDHPALSNGQPLLSNGRTEAEGAMPMEEWEGDADASTRTTSHPRT